MEGTIRTALENHLAEYDLGVDDPARLRNLAWDIPAPLRISHPLGTHKFRAVFTDTPTLTHALQLEVGAGESLLLLAPVIHSRSADGLRSAGIQFLDAAGNAYFRFDGAVIDVRGRRPSPPIAQGHRPPRSSAGLFTPRRAQVIFALLSWPVLLGAPVRALAAAANVSVGQAQSTLKLLDEQGFLDRYSRTLLRTERLAEQWVDAFATGLGPKTLAHTFHGDPLRMDLADCGPVYVSGEKATPWIKQPETATLYMAEFSPKVVFNNRWRTDGVANIMIHTSFWTAQDHDTQQPPHFPAPAPPLLVYADLKSTGETRQLEAAQRVKDDHAHIWHP